MDFIKKPFKISYALTGNLSSWNEPVGIAVREHLVNIFNDLTDEDCVELGKKQKQLADSIADNMFQGLVDDGWYQEYECKPTEELKTDDKTNT